MAVQANVIARRASAVAIQTFAEEMECFASLATTIAGDPTTAR